MFIITSALTFINSYNSIKELPKFRDSRKKNFGMFHLLNLNDIKIAINVH